MATTHNKAIIYDDTCPMCNIYTKAFVQYGFLKSENRLSFTKIDENIASKLDLHRSKHEIPLIDQDTGEVLYGVDSLVFLLSQKCLGLERQ
jgi:predicted DCC family thiol-disulfide oxidoreductase YuxK